MSASTGRLRGVIVGAGYFSQFHFDAWGRIADAELTAVCDVDEERARAASKAYGVARVFRDAEAMFDAERPDFVDIITGPVSHLEICRLAADRGIHVMCQKPLAPTYAEATALVGTARRAGIRLMAH